MRVPEQPGLGIEDRSLAQPLRVGVEQVLDGGRAGLAPADVEDDFHDSRAEI
jgi:hypothetical protein